jgi:hypothetical protein
MRRHEWAVFQVNELAVWRRVRRPLHHPFPIGDREGIPIANLDLRQAIASPAMGAHEPGSVTLHWVIWPGDRLSGDTPFVPWMDLILAAKEGAGRHIIPQGWCLPHIAPPPPGSPARYLEDRRILHAPAAIPAGKYRVLLQLYDRRARLFPKLAEDPQVRQAQQISTEQVQLEIGEIEVRR